MKRWMSILLAVVMIAAMFACTGTANTPATDNTNTNTNTNTNQQTAPAEETKPEKEVNVATGGEVKDTIKIALPKNVSELTGSKGGTNAFNVMFQMYDMLAELDEEMKLTPKLATEWKQINDTTWQFTLREGVKFHDGTDFTAEDAVASIERIVTMEPKYFYASNWGEAWPPAAEADGDYTLIVTTPAYCLQLPNLLSRVPMVPAEYKDSENFFSEKLIGTGAYKFVSWEAGVSIKLEANEDYWDGAPAVKNLQFDIITDQAARLTAFQSGEYDVVFDLPYDNVPALEASGKRVDKIPLVSVSMIYFNPQNFERNPIMANPTFRKALCYAIDSYEIVQGIMGGYGHVVEGIASHQTIGAANGEGLPHYDPDEAQRLMKEAGYNGEEITFFYVNGEFNKAIDMCEYAVSQLEAVGVNVKFQEIESGVWSSTYQGKEGWDICVNNVPGTFTGYADYYWLHALENKIGWRDETVSAYIKEANAAKTIEERTAALEKAMAAAWELYPYLWASEGYGIFGVTDNLAGIEYVPLNILYYRDAYFAN